MLSSRVRVASDTQTDIHPQFCGQHLQMYFFHSHHKHHKTERKTFFCFGLIRILFQYSMYGKEYSTIPFYFLPSLWVRCTMRPNWINLNKFLNGFYNTLEEPSNWPQTNTFAETSTVTLPTAHWTQTNHSK